MSHQHLYLDDHPPEGWTQEGERRVELRNEKEEGR